MLSASLDPVDLIADALHDKRPLLLFAGQTLDPANDAILEAFLDRLGCTDCSMGWRAALERGISPAHMEWLSERFDRSVPSDAVAPILDVPWSAVFTSSIDPRFSRRFETRGRQPESVLSRDTYARVPRSRSRPPIYYLLGKSDEIGEQERAPAKNSDLTRRLSRATDLVNRIAETATLRGLVVIAGYTPGKDWMPADTLLAPLSGQAGPTALWFDYAETPTSNLTDEMLREGSLIATPRDSYERTKPTRSTRRVGCCRVRWPRRARNGFDCRPSSAGHHARTAAPSRSFGGHCGRRMDTRA